MGLVGYQKEYNVWLYLFIVVNIIASLIMFSSNELLGDLESIELYSVNILVFSVTLVVLFYFLIQKSLFNLLTRIKYIKLFPIKKVGKRDSTIIGVIIVFLQISYAVFNIKEGVNTAGALNLKTNSPFALFWVLIPIDAVFTIYYVYYRESNLFKYNLFIFIVSNLLRGWSGVFLIVIFFEWCRSYRNNRINSLYLILLSVIGILLYPFLLNLKWVIRSFSGGNMDILVMISIFKEVVGNKDYLELLTDGLMQLVGRLQQTSVLVEIIHQKDIYQSGFQNGSFLPFWADGLPQLIYRKLINLTAQPNVGIITPSYLLPNSIYELESYNISIGYISWAFIAPYFLPLYLFYTIALCIISVFLIKQMDFKQSSFDVIWFSWLVYLSAGWLSQFIAFIYGIFIFLILVLISQAISKIRLKLLVK